jgi:hypothetical protein
LTADSISRLRLPVCCFAFAASALALTARREDRTFAFFNLRTAALIFFFVPRFCRFAISSAFRTASMDEKGIPG